VLDLGCGSGLCGRVFTSTDSACESGDTDEDILSRSNAVKTDNRVEPTVSSPMTEMRDVSGTSHVDDLSFRTNRDNTARETDSSLTNERDEIAVLLSSSRRKEEEEKEEGGGVFIGIDISQRMVELSERNGGYTCVVRGDITEMSRLLAEDVTSRRCSSFHLVLAADTFIYVGALSEIFSYIRAILCTGGWFAFTTEALELSPMRQGDLTPTPVDAFLEAERLYRRNQEEKGVGYEEPVGAVPGWGAQLLSSARFAHSESYVTCLACMHGFKVNSYQEILLRKEEVVSLPGHAFLLRAI